MSTVDISKVYSHRDILKFEDFHGLVKHFRNPELDNIEKWKNAAARLSPENQKTLVAIIEEALEECAGDRKTLIDFLNKRFNK